MSSPRLRETLQLSQGFTGLEESVRHFDLLTLVKRAGKGAGFSSKMIELLEHYMIFTREIDWEEGARPIVYKSQYQTALDLGISERHVQRLEKQLFEAGAITWNDSGNHKRYGQRDPESGAILYAFGVDLTPLAYLKAELEDIIHQQQLYKAAWMETKRQISWHRSQIKAVLAEIAEQGRLSRAEQRALIASYEDIATSYRTSASLEEMRGLLSCHKTLYNEVLELINAGHNQENDSKESCKTDSNVSHKQDTNQKQSNKLDTSMAPPISFQKSSNENSEPQKVQVEKEESSSSKEEDNLILKTGLQHITLKQALNVASERFRNHMPLKPRPMEWQDFVEAAYKIKGDLFISQQSWANACAVLGRGGAAICVLLTDQAAQREENRVMKPAAYFNAMISRAKSGELKLHQSVFGILKRDNDNLPEGEGRDHA